MSEQRVRARPVDHGATDMNVPGLGHVEVLLDAEGLPRALRTTLGAGPIELPVALPRHPLARALVGGAFEAARRVFAGKGTPR